jgi:glycerophosphoryl diester phosphodiesterase
MNKKSAFQYGLAVMAFFAGCHVAQKAPYLQDSVDTPNNGITATASILTSFDKQGHRGGRGLMPENTIPAMLNALGLGVTTLEMDVVISHDKKVVVSHDPYFNHEISTKPGGEPVTAAEEKSLNLYLMNYDEIRKYDVGMRVHPRFPNQEKISAYKPLLSELLDSVQHYMSMSRRPLPFFNIETKSLLATDGLFNPKPAEFVELLMNVIQKKGVTDRVIIQSFDPRTLQYLHQHYPAVRTALLIEETDKRGVATQLSDLGFTPTIYSPAYQLVNDDLVTLCHQRDIRVIPWTVNDKAKIKSLKKMGVDGVISDYPNLFNEL